jgi:hypothetical protein
MPSEWLTEERQRLVIDPHAHLMAPVVLWGCLGALSSGRDPVASLAEADIGGGSTRWRLAWVCGTDLIYVDALKRREGWTAYDDHEDAGVADELEAWSRPLRSVMTIDLAAAEARRVNDYSDRGEAWHWSSRHSVRFADGTVFSTPLFGEVRNRAHEEAVAHFMSEVLAHRG